MTSPAIRAAFVRASRHNPAFRRIALYAFGTDARGRPDHRTLIPMGETVGTVRWRDTDERLFAEEVGDALVTIVAAVGMARPAAMIDAQGTVYVVKDAEGEDSLGVQRRYRVRRWSEPTPPTIAGE